MSKQILLSYKQKGLLACMMNIGISLAGDRAVAITFDLTLQELEGHSQ